MNKIEISKAREEEIARMQVDDEDEEWDMPDADEDESKMEIIRLKKEKGRKRLPIDKQSAFLEFKSLPEGREIED